MALVLFWLCVCFLLIVEVFFMSQYVVSICTLILTGVGLIVTLAVAIIQVKHEGEKIKEIYNETNSMAPTVENIVTHTSTICPKIQRIDERTAQHTVQLKEIVDDLHERRGQEKRAGAESAAAVKLINANTQVLLDKIDTLTQENQRLQEQVCNLQRKLTRQQNRSQPKRTGYDDLEY